jgi:hypothetical protein
MPKSEIRGPKEGRNPKPELARELAVFGLRPSDF